jgi:hypothetical protein
MLGIEECEEDFGAIKYGRDFIFLYYTCSLLWIWVSFVRIALRLLATFRPYFYYHFLQYNNYFKFLNFWNSNISACSWRISIPRPNMERILNSIVMFLTQELILETKSWSTVTPKSKKGEYFSTYMSSFLYKK